MRGAEIGGMTCQVYRRLKDNRPAGVMTVKELLTGGQARDAVMALREYMRLGREMGLEPDAFKRMKTRVKLENLGAVMVSCVCDGDKGEVTERRPLIALDFDRGDNPRAFSCERAREITKRWLYGFPFVYGVSESCSGEGLYAIVALGGCDRFKERFSALSDFFSAKGLKADPACCNDNRARYLSFDPGALVKGDDDEITVFDGIKERSVWRLAAEAMDKESAARYTPSAEARGLLSDPAFFVAAARYAAGEIDCSDYNDWLAWACRCASFGDEDAAREAFDIISAESAGYCGREACDDKFDEGLKLCEGEEYIALYAACKRKDDDWVRKVRATMSNGLKGLR